MALSKPTDNHKGIQLADTYNVITSATFQKRRDKDNNKLVAVIVIVEKYLSKSDSDNDTNMISATEYEFIDDSLVTENSNAFLSKLYIELKKLGDFASCIDILEI